MSEQENQHFLPQFYLKGFTNPDVPGQVYSYRKGEAHWRKCGVRSVASRDHLHTFRNRAGELDPRIEIMFSRLGTEFAPVLKKVLAGQALTVDEEITFSFFVAVTWQRVPHHWEFWVEQFSAIARLEQQIQYDACIRDPRVLERMKESYREEVGEDIDLRPEHLDPGHVELRADPHYVLMTMLSNASELSKIVFQMGWIFLRSEAPDFFIASDCPVFLHDPTNRGDVYGVGLTHENAELSMPLSRDVPFFACWENTGRRRLPAPTAIVEQVNVRAGGHADWELIAPKRVFPGVDTVLMNFNRQRR